MAPVAAVRVDRRPLADGVQPRCEWSLRIERLGVLPRLEQRALYSFGRHVTIAKNPVGSRVQLTGMPHVDLLDGDRIAVHEADRQPLVVASPVNPP